MTIKAFRACAMMVLVSVGGIGAAQTASSEGHKPQPVARHASTFSLRIKGPYKHFDDKKKEPFVKKDYPFFLKLAFANTADGKVEIPRFDGDSPGIWEIRDSNGKSVLTGQCTKPDETADRPVTKLPPISAAKGERSGRNLSFGSSGACFDRSVPGTYTFQLHVPDPYTGSTVHSNKLKIKVKERSDPQPLKGYDSTFSIRIDGPYKDYSALREKKKELSVKKGSLFLLSLARTNNADDSIVVPEITGDIAHVWKIVDSDGTSVLTERCTKPRALPRVRIINLPFIGFLEKGERGDGGVLSFGNPDNSCFETDVPGTYTFQLHVPDPYTRTVVYSNKLKIKVTE